VTTRTYQFLPNMKLYPDTDNPYFLVQVRGDEQTTKILPGDWLTYETETGDLLKVTPQEEMLQC